MLRVLLLAAGALVLARSRSAERFTTSRILRVSRVVADLDRAVLFYVEALGFRLIGAGGLPADGPGGRRRRCCGSAPRRSRWCASRSPDSPIRGVAKATIVGSSISPSWCPISMRPIATSAKPRGGRRSAQAARRHLPQGGVRAFKFRDPDGHPLELIWYPPGVGRPIWNHGVSTERMLGIDHSALAVGATVRSLAFYRRLGLRVAARSWNRGLAQDRLDGLANARVRVTALRPAESAGLGIELLGYQPPGRTAAGAAPNDVVTDWVTLSVSPSPGASPRALRDPDGHWLLLVGPGPAAPPCGGKVT